MLFLILCITLITIYAFISIFTASQLIFLIRHEMAESAGFIRTLTSFLLSTTQKMIFFLLSLLLVSRIIFFVLALVYWNSVEGEIRAEISIFHFMDGLCRLIFFSVISVLTLFCAEMYYISLDSVIIYKRLVAPALYALNITSYVGLVLCAVLSKNSGSDNYYFYPQFSYGVATLYVVISLLFGYFSKSAISEFKKFPITLEARKLRVHKLLVMMVVTITATILNACLIVAYNNKKILNADIIPTALTFLYYFFLEATPILAIGIFFSTPDIRNTTAAIKNNNNNNSNYQETQKIEPPDFTYGTWEPTRKLVQAYENGGAPDDLVDEIMQKILDYNNSFN